MVNKKLIGLLSKFFNYRYIRELLEKGYEGEKLYKILHEKYDRRKETNDLLSKKSLYLEYIYREKLIVPFIGGDIYLDVGCEETKTISHIGKVLGVKKSECINIKDENSIYLGYGDKSNIKIYDGVNIPYKNESIDFLSCYMVLHHIPPINRLKLIRDIYRVLKKGGYLIIKEHNSMNRYDEHLIDVEHAIYEMVIPEKINSNFLKKYKAYYFSKEYLENKLLKLGFKIKKIYFTPYKKINYTNKYFLLAQKI